MKHAICNLWVGFGVILFCGMSGLPAAGQVLVWGDNQYNQTRVPAGLTNVIAVAGGDYHCLALQADGSVTAWGLNVSGQTNVPPDLTNVVSIAAGSTHSLALRRDGTVALWGSVTGFGVDGNYSMPPDATNIVSLALGPGAQHVLALRADGTVLESGCNASPSLTNPPPSAQHVVAVAAGSFYSLALRADGRVVAWGQNPFYSGVTNMPASATNIVAIAAGWHTSIALRADGTLLVWGNASLPPWPVLTNLVEVAGSSGRGATPMVLALKSDGTLLNPPWSGTLPTYPTNQVTAIGSGSYNGLLVAGTGAPVFPGLPANRTVPRGARAYFRQLASGAMPIAYQWTCNGTNLPGATNSILTVTNVQPELAGTSYALVASNSFGQATSGPVRLDTVPFDAWLQSSTASALVGQSVTLSTATIGSGPFSYQWLLYGTNLPTATNATLTLTRAQLSDAGPYSVVVSNAFGQFTSSLNLPVVPTLVTNAPQSQLGFPGATVSFSLGLRALIPVSYQWQFNGVNLDGATSNSLTLTNLQFGQAGTYQVIYTDAYETVTNTLTLSVIPAAAWGNWGQQTFSSQFTNLLALSAGGTHWLGLKADGTVLVSGNGMGAFPPPALSNVIAVAAGNGHNLALQSDGTVTAWGANNDGQTSVPSGLSNVVALAAGDFHALALKADGSIVGWGNNTYGQTNVPAGLTNVVAIAAGEWNSMALRADGTVAAWGAGTNVSPNPNFGQSIVPAGLSNVVQISTGGLDDLALRADGSLVGWGDNGYGEDTLPPGLSNIVSVAGGYSFTLALKADGTVAAWGYTGSYSTQVPSGLTNVVAITAKDYNCGALIGSGPPPAQVPLLNPHWTGQGFTLSVPSSSGHTYRLEYKDSLNASDWTALPLVAGTGGVLSLIDPNPAAAQRFYRVRRW